MDIFALAEYKVQKFDKVSVDNKNYIDRVFETAKKIRHFLDIQIRNKKVALARYKK